MLLGPGQAGADRGFRATAVRRRRALAGAATTSSSICTLLDFEPRPAGQGLFTSSRAIAIGSGGIFGKGVHAGTQTHLGYIPERTTDFIFAAFFKKPALGNLLLIAASSS